MQETAGRPSPVWTLAATVCVVAALAAGTLALRHQTSATRPIGEGELFLDDSTWAAGELSGRPADSLDMAVRRVRNSLGVEAAWVVTSDGVVVAATSQNLVGTALEEPLLASGIERGRLTAVAAQIRQPISIDGVVEWRAGDVLYLVLHPLAEGEGAVVLAYDVSNLLQRRARMQGVQTLTLQLMGAALVLAAIAALLATGRRGAVRSIEDSRREARRLQERSQDLEEHNRALQEAREQAERALALAEETNRIRSEFVLMINHELRTPLTGVVTGAELLEEDSGLEEEDRRALVEDMVRDGRRLRDLITQMLAVARIENRGLSYTLRETPVREVLDRLAGMTSRVQVRALQGADPDSLLRTDPDALAQLLASLVDNAYSHGASQVEIEPVRSIAWTPDVMVGMPPGDGMHFVVSDDGPGIDPEFLPRVFEKFEKHSRSAGTGLGLYVAKLMVEAIEGSLSVASSSEGTRMAVAVPMAARTVNVEVAA